MGVTGRLVGQAPADLALILTAASARVGAVLDVAAKAAAEMIGDSGAVRLVGEHGRYDDLVVHQPQSGLATTLTQALAGMGDRTDEGVSVTLRTTRLPVLLSADDLRRLAPGRPDVSAAVLCPLIADGAYAGYLAAARTVPDGPYSAADVELAVHVTGEVASALSVARSVERLLASEEHYRSIVEATQEGVWQLDPDGITVFVNDPMAEMLGLPRQQLVGLSMRGFLDDRGQAELPRLLAACREGRAGIYRTQLVRADGAARWVQVSAGPLPGDSEHPDGSLCMVTDITDQVQERGLKRQLDHLRRLDSLGQLIGGIAHDFNNLFTVVAGSAELLAGEAQPGSEWHQLATQIADATVRGRSLAHQLLAFGRTGGGRSETILIPDLLNDVQQLLSRTLGEHIRLEVDIALDIWPVRAERGALEQVMINLAANARDAMPRGGVLAIKLANTTITAGDLPGAATELSGQFVRVSISDTGTGMDHETRQRAFEPFFTTKLSSAGLGLATADSIIRGFGGYIQLESEPRMGTTITLHLPATAPAQATTPDAGGVTTLPRGHILVVEDQPELAQLIRYLLQPAGYTVTVATDPQAALTYFNAGMLPDLVLTDVMMPGMTGPELAAELRVRHADLRVLYMSGYAGTTLGARGTLDENSVLIQKPFNRDTLLAAVQRAWR